jgi:enamine deaminase RidA (YjgF/YER057c/UK114 family)
VPASTEFVRAGNWVFGTGLRGAASPELFRRMEAGLEAAGSSMSLVARVDQYYPDLSCVVPYQAARKKAFEHRQVAPSTSVLVSMLRDSASQVDVQVMAATLASGYLPAEVHTGLNRPDSSGYAPCLRVGDLIFVAGQLARDAAGQLAAHGVRAETEYLVQHRLLPALQAAQSAPDLVLKAQVYVSRPADIPAFWAVWKGAFGKRLPPTTVVPVRHPAFLTSAATVEVNVIAAHGSARSRVRDVPSEVQARILDALLFVGALSGPGALAQAAGIFSAAGTDLTHVVRALFFHAKGAAPADPGFPYSAFEVEAGSTLDLWGYVP